ncbi:ASKHA domain-containing protein [Desulfobacula sp.]|uniref:ASKHA domain-containing protein n=1 Tax=Desulfobacula sp. TaxID=2593537 RepID=UPI00262148AD|nr:ASKHA domain-containing protein [Desulfobacula sp.]
MMPQKGFVRTILVETPSLTDNTADAQRLEKCLLDELCTDKIRIPLQVLKNLPSNLRSWGFKARAVLFKDRHSWILVDLLNPISNKPVLGTAVDIGTTRITMSLIDLESGQEIGEAGFDNPQAVIGPDVLARIHYSSQNTGLDELNHLVIDAVNLNMSALCKEYGYQKENIYLVTGAGNTTMTHLFLGIESFEIIKEPYIPCVNIPDTQPAGSLGLDINENGVGFLFPNIGSYFGGDLISGILFSDLDQKEDPCIMVDVGTNAEIVVGNKDWLIACAGAAGPALEGGVSKMGMTAKPGVIDQVWIDPYTRDLMIHTIDGKKPVGICGSGMIDLAASLFLSKRIDIRGKFFKPACGERLLEKDGINHFILVDENHSGTGEPICLSQVDLNSLTSSKAAMYTILEVIVKNTAGLEFEDLHKFYVAGTFGSFINPVSAISIGMLPDLHLETFEVLGNSSLGGAKVLLKNPDAFERIMKIRQSITYIELNVNQEFMNMFSGAKFYPHTDESRFPSLQNMI